MSNSNYQNTILNTDNSFQQNEIAEKYNVLEINSQLFLYLGKIR